MAEAVVRERSAMKTRCCSPVRESRNNKGDALQCLPGVVGIVGANAYDSAKFLIDHHAACRPHCPWPVAMRPSIR